MAYMRILYSMNRTANLKNRVSIRKSEYLRLKKMDERFRDFFAYIENVIDVREARKQITQKRVVSQEKLFKQLGL